MSYDHEVCLGFPDERGKVINDGEGFFAIWDALVHNIQKEACQTFFPNPPLIVYSHKDPHEDQYWNWDNGFSPTDLMGAYFCGDARHTGYCTKTIKGRRIEIYPERIETCAQQLFPVLIQKHNKLTAESVRTSLERVVVIHELQHALLHLGCTRRLDGGSNRPTNQDITEHLVERLSFFRTLTSRVREQHAQLGTWHLIKDESDIAEVFCTLMKGQPKKYRLDAKLMKTPPRNLWAWMCLARKERLCGLRNETELRCYVQTGEINPNVGEFPTLGDVSSIL
jgi:hypothetical protein